MSRPLWLRPLPSLSRLGAGLPGRADLMAVTLALVLAVVLAMGVSQTFAPMSGMAQISLDPLRLPFYAVRTVLRMLAAMTASLIFTLTYGTLAAKSRRAELVLIPLLDILQSVPILGYLAYAICLTR